MPQVTIGLVDSNCTCLSRVPYDALEIVGDSELLFIHSFIVVVVIITGIRPTI